MMRCRSILASVLLCACAVARPLQPQSAPDALRPVFRLLPADEAKDDPSFAAFRAGLLRAIADRDVEAVMAVLDPTFQGREGLRLGFTAVVAGSPENSQWQWRTLADVLAHGGGFTTTRGHLAGRREFCAPYSYALYPKLKSIPDEMYDPQYPWIVMGEHVAVRQARSASAAVIATVSYEILPVIGGKDEWAEVVLADHRHGYVAGQDIRSPWDYHACFAMIEGTWRMTEFERGRLPWG